MDKHTSRLVFSRGAEVEFLRVMLRNALLRAYCDSLEDEAAAEAERLRLELVSQQQGMSITRRFGHRTARLTRWNLPSSAPAVSSISWAMGPGLDMGDADHFPLYDT